MELRICNRTVEVMVKIVKHVYLPGEEQDFSEKAITGICTETDAIYYLSNYGYNMKTASIFAGNHCMML